jgi:NADH:ubiquinone oxidoreductase subunit K
VDDDACRRRLDRRVLAHAPGMGFVRAARPARPASPPRARRPKEDGLMSIAWFLVVSAMVFSIGAGGVLTRRNPLVVLLCLELMLNAANLALLAFSRMWGNGDGQVFAIVVIVVAACEVCIGLGVVVAMFRRRLPVDVDEMTELSG